MAGEWFSGLSKVLAGEMMHAESPMYVKEANDWIADGERKMENSAEACWGKDGDVTKFAESVPGVGYVAAAGHGIAGDHQRARRAAASSTKSTLVAAGGVAGAAVGGPAGAVAGAAVGSAAGQCAERGINHAIDKEHQTSAGTFNDFDAKEFGGEMLVDTAMGGVGAGTGNVGKAASRAMVGPSMKQAGKVAVKNPGRYVTKRAVEQTVTLSANAAAKPVVKKAVKKTL